MELLLWSFTLQSIFSPHSWSYRLQPSASVVSLLDRLAVPSSSRHLSFYLWRSFVLAGYSWHSPRLRGNESLLNFQLSKKEDDIILWKYNLAQSVSWPKPFHVQSWGLCQWCLYVSRERKRIVHPNLVKKMSWTEPSLVIKRNILHPISSLMMIRSFEKADLIVSQHFGIS